MATIAIASDKGGPGKTTTAILVGAELALDGTEPASLTLTSINKRLHSGRNVISPSSR